MKKVIVCLLLGVGILHADFHKVCWVYEPQDFVAWDGFVETQSEEVRDIEGVYIWKKKNLKEIVLVVKTARHIYKHPFISLYEKDDIFKYTGACDSGQLQLDEKMRLRLEFLYFFAEEESPQGPKVELVLKPKKTDSFLSATKTTCPEYLLEGMHVCYSHKFKHQYEGCMRSRESCESIGKRHFGKYLTEETTETAYWRCVRSEPREVHE